MTKTKYVVIALHDHPGGHVSSQVLKSYRKRKQAEKYCDNQGIDKVFIFTEKEYNKIANK